MHRRKPVRRSKPRQYNLSPGLEADIRDYFAAHPRASYMEAGAALNCSIGRVSEALAGFRG